MIISQISTAIGTLIWLPAPNSRPRSLSISAGPAAEQHADDHAQADPEGQVALEDVQALRAPWLAYSACRRALTRASATGAMQ